MSESTAFAGLATFLKAPHVPNPMSAERLFAYLDLGQEVAQRLVERLRLLYVR